MVNHSVFDRTASLQPKVKSRRTTRQSRLHSGVNPEQTASHGRLQTPEQVTFPGWFLAGHFPLLGLECIALHDLDY
jgi:hypothetical protein